MPLKRTYSTTTSIVPSAYQQYKRRYIKGGARKRSVLRWAGGAVTVGRPMPFPTRMAGKLTYCETITRTESVSPQNIQFMSCNSLYDPNATGAGHQPYGHDTYATIYNQYTVMKAKITVTAAQLVSNTNAFTWGIGIVDDTATNPGYDYTFERPTHTIRPMMQIAGQQGKPLTLWWDRNKRFPKQDTYASLSASFGSSPAEQEYFEIAAQAGSPSSNLGTIYYFIQIDYYCEFYELKDLGSS